MVPVSGAFGRVWRVRVESQRSFSICRVVWQGVMDASSEGLAKVK